MATQQSIGLGQTPATLLCDTRAMNLLDQANAVARELLATGAPVFLPVNPVEYHGPHLSLHNDGLISAGFTKDLYAALAVEHPDWPLLEVSDLEVGVEAVQGPGTRSIPYDTVLDLVLRACESLVRLGAKRVVLQTFHGSPLHDIALERGARWLRAQGVPAVVPLNYLIHSFIEADASTYDVAYATIEDEALRKQLQSDFLIDFHAGFMETSLTLHYAPDSVDPRRERLPKCPPFEPDARVMRASKAARALGRKHLAAELGAAAYGLGWYALRPFPGYSGHPALANARAGEAFANVFVEALTPLVSRALDGRPPPLTAPAPWLHYATIRGRLGNVTTPLEQVLTQFPA